jgi:signal transduction histidine kinase
MEGFIYKWERTIRANNPVIATGMHTKNLQSLSLAYISLKAERQHFYGQACENTIARRNSLRRIAWFLRIALVGILLLCTIRAACAQTIARDSLQQHYQTYQRVKGNLVPVQNRKQTNTSSLSYQTNQTEQRLQLLRIENQQKQAIIQYWQCLAIGAILLLCVGTSVSLYLANGQKKANQELERQKTKVTTKNSQLVQLNREVIQQNQQLEQLNRVKNQLLSIISHDVRAPLRSIQGVVTLAKLDALSLSEINQLLDKLSGEVQHTSQLLDNILNWARSQMEGLYVQKAPIDLRSIAIENLELYGPLAEKKQLSLQCTLMEPLLVNGDEEMIKTVVRNLINNAIKFSYPNGTITLSAQQREGEVQFTVQDTGVGIKAEDLPRILSDRPHTSLGTRQEKGTGLGLQVCKDFITQHEGQIWVESQPEVGTAFHFTLPLAVEVSLAE